VTIIALQDRNGALKDDGPVVEVLVNEVDGAASDLHSVVECLLLGVEAWKCR